MSEDLRALLTRRVQLIDAYIAGLPRRADEASRFLASYPAKLAQASRDRAEVLQVLATLGVPAAPLAPRDITTSPGRLELGVAGLSISPGERPSTEDLRLYAGTMRAMYEQAVTQARQATDLIHAFERREQQAIMDTGPWDPTQVTKQNDTVQNPSERPPLCKHCRKPVAIDRQDDWFHIDAGGGTYACYPDGIVSTDAEPADAQPAATTSDPSAEHPAAADPAQPDPAIPGVPPDRPDLPCPYCGHRYGPTATDQDIATHLAVCPGPPSNPAIAAGIDHGATWINDHRGLAEDGAADGTDLSDQEAGHA